MYVSKRVLLLAKLLLWKRVDAHENEPADETRFHMTGFVRRLVLTQGNSEVAYWAVHFTVCLFLIFFFLISFLSKAIFCYKRRYRHELIVHYSSFSSRLFSNDWSENAKSKPILSQSRNSFTSISGHICIWWKKDMLLKRRWLNSLQYWTVIWIFENELRIGRYLKEFFCR